MQKINKIKARKIFNTQKTFEIKLFACKCTPEFWTGGTITEKNRDFYNDSFDTIINGFESFNCNSNMGKYCAYYI